MFIRFYKLYIRALQNSKITTPKLSQKKLEINVAESIALELSEQLLKFKGDKKTYQKQAKRYRGLAKTREITENLIIISIISISIIVII